MPNPTLRQKIESRVAELEAVLEKLDPADRTRNDIVSALRAVARLTTGDMDNIPSPTAKELQSWLETSRLLGVKP